MSELSKVKLVSGDRKKTQHGKGHVVKKIHRKAAEKQTDDVGKLSVNVENTHAIHLVTDAKPKVQQRALNTPKKGVKKLISQSVAKSPTQKPSTKKNVATKQPLIKIQKPPSNKKSPGVRNPNSITLNKVETKRIKPVKRVVKATPMIVTLPRDITSHQADGTKLSNPAEKPPVKVKRLLRKKLLSSKLTTKPKNVSSMAVENVLPIGNTTKLFPGMTKQT